MLEKVLLGKEKVRLYLAHKNKDEIILNFKNVYYLLGSLSNFASFAFFNNYKIYYNNKKEKLYEKFLERIFASAKR